MVGCAIAGVFAILEFLYGTRQSAKDADKSWLEEMRGEMDFIMQCHGNTRELCNSESSSSSSSSSSNSLDDLHSHAYSRHKVETKKCLIVDCCAPLYCTFRSTIGTLEWFLCQWGQNPPTNHSCLLIQLMQQNHALATSLRSQSQRNLIVKKMNTRILKLKIL